MEEIAQQTEGYSGADISGMINNAGVIALRKKLPAISLECLNHALEKKKTRDSIITKQPSKITP